MLRMGRVAMVMATLVNNILTISNTIVSRRMTRTRRLSFATMDVGLLYPGSDRGLEV